MKAQQPTWVLPIVGLDGRAISSSKNPGSVSYTHLDVYKRQRPYQQIPFQFSVHRLSRTGKLEHRSFLDLSGEDPSLGFAKTLVAACGDKGPIFAYNAGFEKSRILELATRFPRMATALKLSLIHI